MRGKTTVKITKMCAAAVLAFGASVGTASAVVIDFGGLAGANGAAFSSYAEDGFTVNAAGGSWFEGHAFGNPSPSIFAGPIGSPALSTVKVTQTGGSDFKFVAVDFSSNGGTSTYTIQGLLNGIEVLSLSGTTGPFNTVSDGSGTTIDELMLTLNPTGEPGSMNVDNINVNVSAVKVPEPGSLIAMLTGLAAFGLARRRRVR